MAHGSKVVDFAGLHSADDVDEVGRIAEIPVVEEELDTGLVAVLVDVVNAPSVEGGGAADDAVDLGANTGRLREVVLIVLGREEREKKREK